jgi:hypothetical protein
MLPWAMNDCHTCEVRRGGRFEAVDRGRKCTSTVSITIQSTLFKPGPFDAEPGTTGSSSSA